MNDFLEISDVVINSYTKNRNRDNVLDLTMVVGDIYRKGLLFVLAWKNDKDISDKYLIDLGYNFLYKVVLQDENFSPFDGEAIRSILSHLCLSIGKHLRKTIAPVLAEFENENN